MRTFELPNLGVAKRAAATVADGHADKFRGLSQLRGPACHVVGNSDTAQRVLPGYRSELASTERRHVEETTIIKTNVRGSGLIP